MDARMSVHQFLTCEEPPKKRQRLVGSAEYSSCHSRAECSSEHVPTADTEATSGTFLGNAGPNGCYGGPERFSPGNTPRPDDWVCFGMVAKVPVRLHRNHELDPSQPLVACSIDRDGNVVPENAQDSWGVIPTDTAEAFYVLWSTQEIWIQMTLLFGSAYGSGKQGAEADLNAIVYGQFDLFEGVGEFAQACDLYLQDPEGCSCNVPYLNPHRLSKREPPIMTFDLSQCREDRLFDLSGTFESTDTLEMAETPDALNTKLHPHQQRALAFMRRREKGWALCGPHPDVWAKNRAGFVNCITGDRQVVPPKEFRGGILADDMGLGKTLSMLALVASDKNPVVEGEDELSSSISFPENYVDSTLIVVPPPLLSVWSFQLGFHLRPGCMTWTKHYSTTRLTELSILREHDIILTSYQTIVADYNKNKYKSPLFTAHWKRIILDEAHVIRESNNVTSKAIFSLKADRRWAITGTPIQNCWSDFASLLEFLRVHPFDEKGAFDKYIQRPWKEHGEQEAIDRLKRLVHCIVLRRLKTTIQLPERQDHTIWVDFTPEERAYYKEMSYPVEQMLDALAYYDTPRRSQFSSVIQRISILRMICDLGDSCKGFTQTQPSPLSLEGTWSTARAQESFGYLLNTGESLCLNCSMQVTTTAESSYALSVPAVELPRIFKCQKLLCGSCFTQSGTPRSPGVEYSGCGCFPTCPSEIVRINTDVGLSPSPQPTSSASPKKISSKVLALVKDIQAHLHEKSVVFSFWTRSLDMVERALDPVGIKSVRFDGRVSASSRDKALKALRTDPLAKVMLITTSCGAVGLDLTAASRAYLLEPHWNPTTEDQALARVHRMGQKRPVTTIRFIVRNSFEEHVMRVQEQKRQLADLFFSSSKPGHASTAQEK